jgi:hypothetical protein
MPRIRPAGRRGMLPRDTSKHALTFESYLYDQAALPAAPLTVDRMTKVASFPMYCNGPDPSNPPQIPDGIGDCTCAGILHAISCMSAFSGRIPGGAVFDNNAAVSLYSAASGYVLGNESTDNGATLASVCNVLMNVGVEDVTGEVHKLVAWCEVGDVTDNTLRKQILNLTGTVYMGFAMPTTAEEDFENGLPFTPGGPGEDGHCMVEQYYTDVIDDQTLITWGAEQKANEAWMRKYTTEAIVLISEDWIEVNGDSIGGFDMQQLIADMALVK